MESTEIKGFIYIGDGDPTYGGYWLGVDGSKKGVVIEALSSSDIGEDHHWVMSGYAEFKPSDIRRTLRDRGISWEECKGWDRRFRRAQWMYEHACYCGYDGDIEAKVKDRGNKTTERELMRAVRAEARRY